MKKLLGLLGRRARKQPDGTRADLCRGIHVGIRVGGGGGGGQALTESGRRQSSLVSVDRRIRLGRGWALVRNRSGSAPTLLRRRP